MRMPTTPEQWKKVATEFEHSWQFPHCIGAIDGKHVTIRSPSHSGSLYYNYKGTFSVVLMGVVDACYIFITVDIGSYGKQSDAGIFSHSSLGKALKPPNTLNLPCDATIDGAEHLGQLPYVAVGDEAFPLQHHMMRPFPGRNCTQSQQEFNYRLSRARRLVECAFGILAARWRVYHTKIAILPQNVDTIIQATTVLHNLLQIDSTPAATEELILEGSNQPAHALHDLPNMGTRGTQDAMMIRDKFKDYFQASPLPWQREHVQRGLND